MKKERSEESEELKRVEKYNMNREIKCVENKLEKRSEESREVKRTSEESRGVKRVDKGRK